MKNIPKKLLDAAIDGVRGYYDGAVTLEDITDNILTIAIAPQVCTDAGMVHLQVSLIHGQSQITTFCNHIHVAALPRMLERSEVCSPCIDTRIVAQADGQSTMSVTVCGIYEGLVTDIFLEYVLCPSNENEPVLVPIEVGDYNLVNGHIYSASIPIVENFRYRGVIHYVDTDGNTRVYEECWNDRSDTMRGFWEFSQEAT